MFAFGLLLTLCSIPGYTAYALPTQWAVLSIILPFSLWREGPPLTSLHYLGLGFLVFATLGLFWVPSIWNGIGGLWMIGILALSFWYGSVATSLVPLYKGLAIGLAINSFLAVAQSFGLAWPPTYANNYAGLLFSPVVLGAAIAILIPPLTRYAPIYIPALLPGLYISHSRGAYLALAAGLLVRWLHWSVILFLGLLTAILFLGYLAPSDAVRLQTWTVAYHGLSLFGWGPGSFNSVFFPFQGDIAPFTRQLIHPEFTHNDYLQLWFEFGVGAIAIYAILACAVVFGESATAACLALYFFPFYYPLTGFLALAIAGHHLRHFRLAWLLGPSRRFDFVPWIPTPRPITNVLGDETLPAELRYSHSKA